MNETHETVQLFTLPSNVSRWIRMGLPGIVVARCGPWQEEVRSECVSAGRENDYVDAHQSAATLNVLEREDLDEGRLARLLVDHVLTPLGYVAPRPEGWQQGVTAACSMVLAEAIRQGRTQRSPLTLQVLKDVLSAPELRSAITEPEPEKPWAVKDSRFGPWTYLWRAFPERTRQFAAAAIDVFAALPTGGEAEDVLAQYSGSSLVTDQFRRAVAAGKVIVFNPDTGRPGAAGAVEYIAALLAQCHSVDVAWAARRDVFLVDAVQWRATRCELVRAGVSH